VIAVVYANGQTDMERGMAALSLSRTIRELADNKRVKALVIRMDSPGGSAEAADYMDEAVRYAKQKKPVVVSMGQTAASGGYWAGMSASHISATPYTITGSIGVIGSWFYDNGMYSKLGVNMDTIQRGAHSDLLAGLLIPQRDLTAPEEERYKTYILDLYGIFTEKVAASRNMELAKVEAVAQGRIFSGTRALEAGLIDSVGSLSDALKTAQKLAEIKEDAKILYREYPEPKFFDKLMSRIPLASILFKKSKSASFIADLLLPSPDIRYRLEMNGKVMPIMPLEFNFN
jgi:protease-4